MISQIYSVNSVRLSKIKRTIKLPIYQDSKRLRGYGHITFADPASAQKAVLAKELNLDNRRIVIEMAKGEKERPGKSIEEMKKMLKGSELKTIFVKNLPYDLKEEELGDFFSVCGVIENVRFVYNSVNGNFKGFAYIDFKNPSSLFAAIKNNGKEFRGRKIIVDIE